MGSPRGQGAAASSDLWLLGGNLADSHTHRLRPLVVVERGGGSSGGPNGLPEVSGAKGGAELRLAVAEFSGTQTLKERQQMTNEGVEVN